MRRTSIGCLLALVLLGSAVWSQSGKDASAEKEVAALEQKWLESQKTNNADLIVPLLADNFIETTSEGKIIDGKAATVAASKATKWSSAEYSDVHVRVFGTTAIATGRFIGKGTDDSNKPFDTNERWTDTWVKMPNGKWQCVASHASAVKM
jgi:ketosteroid isomerase-like protein